MACLRRLFGADNVGAQWMRPFRSQIYPLGFGKSGFKGEDHGYQMGR